jgi:hypothetical protein
MAAKQDHKFLTACSGNRGGKDETDSMLTGDCVAFILFVGFDALSGVTSHVGL